MTMAIAPQIQDGLGMQPKNAISFAQYLVDNIPAGDGKFLGIFEEAVFLVTKNKDGCVLSYWNSSNSLLARVAQSNKFPSVESLAAILKRKIVRLEDNLMFAK